MNVNYHIQETREQGWVLSVCSGPAAQAAPRRWGLSPAGTGKLLSWPFSHGVWVFVCMLLKMAGLREVGLERRTLRKAPGVMIYPSLGSLCPMYHHLQGALHLSFGPAGPQEVEGHPQSVLRMCEHSQPLVLSSAA